MTRVVSTAGRRGQYGGVDAGADHRYHRLDGEPRRREVDGEEVVDVGRVDTGADVGLTILTAVIYQLDIGVRAVGRQLMLDHVRIHGARVTASNYSKRDSNTLID